MHLQFDKMTEKTPPNYASNFVESIIKEAEATDKKRCDLHYLIALEYVMQIIKFCAKCDPPHEMETTESHLSRTKDQKLLPAEMEILEYLEIQLKKGIEQVTKNNQKIHTHICAKLETPELYIISQLLNMTKAKIESNSSDADLKTMNLHKSCDLIEQLFKSTGRLSPLEDMYTEEETEMLKSLGS